jgi:hypothetical protein
MNNTGIFIWFDSNFDLKQKNLRKKLSRKFCFSFYPKMLDPDPDWTNPDTQPWFIFTVPG